MTLVTIADAPKAYCAFLRARVGDRLAIATLPGSGAKVPAVFRPDMPRWFQSSMPASAIIVRPAGGYTAYGKSMQPIADVRVDVLCYGPEDGQQQATELAQAVAVASKQLSVEVWEDTLLMAANVSAGPVPLPDAQTLWPACWLSIQLVHGEYPQPA